MKRLPYVLLLSASLGSTLYLGYWYGLTQTPSPSPVAQSSPPERKILYYKNPMGLPDTSPTPKKDAMGMDYVPVYAESTAPPKAERKILYYKNPMGLPDTSSTPKKDAMGMDYVPVYEGEVPQGKQVVLNTEKIQKLGVRTEAAILREISRPVRAVGMLQVDERLLHAISPRFEGWIEVLHVNATGQTVNKGEPLLAVYSPELMSAQQEYLIALGGRRAMKEDHGHASGMNRLAEASLNRLRLWEIPEEEIARLRKEGKAEKRLTLRSPVDGVVLEKSAVAGMRFMAGETLYKLADLSTLWMIAEIFEQDLARVQVGQSVIISVNAFPGRVFEGTVSFIQPTTNPQTRTTQVRIELANPDDLLKPSMYASLTLSSREGGVKVLAVPESAILHTGAREVVLVELAQGRFEPREVKTGIHGDAFVEILSGLGEEERVVVTANFLIDAESNLKSALESFGDGKAPQGSAP